MSFLVTFAITRRFNDRANQRQPDLTAVRVTREQKVNACGHLRKDIGIVRQRNYRRAFRNLRQRFIDALRPGPKIAETNEPQRIAAHVDRGYFILEHFDTVSFERATNLLAVVPPIVITEDRIDAQRRVQIFQQWRKHFRLDTMTRTTVARDVVAENNDQIRLQLVRTGNDQ